MARNYQLKRNNRYYMPHDLYMRVQYIIKGYDRLKKDYMDILYSSPPPPDGMPRGNENGSPTERKALKLEQIGQELEAIDQSCVEIRGKYSGKTDEEFDPIKAYWSYDYFNYVHKRKNEGDLGPSRRTWNYYKAMLSGLIAQKLNLF